MGLLRSGLPLPQVDLDVPHVVKILQSCVVMCMCLYLHRKKICAYSDLHLNKHSFNRKHTSFGIIAFPLCII